MTTPVPPGWYPDPNGEPGQRYWDGQQWTVTLKPPPLTPVAIPYREPAPKPEARPAPPIQRNKTMWVIAGTVVGLTALVVAAVLTAPEDRTIDTAFTKTTAPRTLAPEQIQQQQQEAEQRRQLEAARLDPTSYDILPDDHDFALLLKEPDQHKGERYEIFGHITQFDTNTGRDSFRANISNRPETNWEQHFDSGRCGDDYCIPEVNTAAGYQANSIINAGVPGILTDIAEGDYVRMYVEIDGTTTYKSTLGVEQTVPVFTVYVIDRCPEDQPVKPGANIREPNIKMQPACEVE